MEAVKRGAYAIYHGKEYQVSMDAYTGEDLLVSTHADSQQEGFVPWDGFPGLYKKELNQSELESAYHCRTYAVYQGLTFEVQNVKGNIVFLVHSGEAGSKEAMEIGFKFVDRWWFEKDVPVDEIEGFRVEMTPMWGFPLPTSHQGE